MKRKTQSARPSQTPNSPIPALERRDPWILFALGVILLLWNIDFPSKLNFDEFHYIPAAKNFLALSSNSNWEHPPLAKILIAIGIGIFGDQPLGWRASAVLAGAATWAGVYALSWALWRNRMAAWLGVLLSAFNFLLYVQGRIAMLDTFMMAFLIWGFAASVQILQTQSWESHQNQKWLKIFGLTFGAAIACKWAALFPYALLTAWIGLDRLAKASNKIREFRQLAISLVLIPAAVYFVTFLPYLLYQTPNYDFWSLFSLQKEMYLGQKRVVNSHPYLSDWMGWLWLQRPIWYAFDKEGEDWVRGVFLVGNPLLMIGGLPLLVWTAWRALKKTDFQSRWLIAIYASVFLIWAILPRKVTFYYYYYPAGMVLTLIWVQAWTYCRSKLQKSAIPLAIFLVAVSAGLFVYFFPILSAQKIPAESFRQFMWSDRWI